MIQVFHFVASVSYRKRFPFYDILTKAVADKMPQKIADEIAKITSKR